MAIYKIIMSLISNKQTRDEDRIYLNYDFHDVIDKVERLRKNLNPTLTQKQFSHKVNISYNTYSNYVNYVSDAIKVTTLLKMAYILNVSICELLQKSGD